MAFMADDVGKLCGTPEVAVNKEVLFVEVGSIPELPLLESVVWMDGLMVTSVGPRLVDELLGNGGIDPVTGTPLLPVVLGCGGIELSESKELRSVTPVDEVYPPGDPLVGALVPWPDGTPDTCVGPVAVVELAVGNDGWPEDDTADSAADAEWYEVANCVVEIVI